MSALEIQQLPRQEKLKLMEMLWAELSREEAELESPTWHADALRETAEHRALRYDLGEGLLEIALVLSSLYFISRKQMFPVIGIVAGIAGAALAITGLLV